MSTRTNGSSPAALSLDVGAVIARHMDAGRWSARRLAAAAGIHQGSLSARLRGPRAFRIDELAAGAGLLGVRPSVLVREAERTTHPTSG